MGSMSASGKWPGPRYGVQSRNRSNCSRSNDHLSQKSSLMRHMLACVLTFPPADRGVAPGEVLKMIFRPVQSIALRMASISG